MLDEACLGGAGAGKEGPQPGASVFLPQDFVT